MKTNKQQLHQLLENMVTTAVKSGESRTITFSIPYYELAAEMGLSKWNKQASYLNLKFTITTEFTDDDDETYETGDDFSIQNKIRN